MDPITILFFSLASMLGVEDSRIVSRKATVTIHPLDKTFVVNQEDLFSIMMMPEDSLTVADELHHILAFDHTETDDTASGLIVDHIQLSKNGQQLDAKITGHYTDLNAFAETGISIDSLSTPEFSLINIEDWNIRSSDGVLEGNYWVWPAGKPFTFTMEAFEHIPAAYLNYQQSVLPYYDRSLKN